MYYIPQTYLCPDCGHEMKFSPSDVCSTPVFDDAPVCPKCWERFVKSRVPTMRRPAFEGMRGKQLQEPQLRQPPATFAPAATPVLVTSKFGSFTVKR